tara:strand:+ start:113 stop:718 length:606 start_codon:yes stop_codon:yes gene_type:complete
MSFKKNKYTIIKNAIKEDLAIFIANYFLLKRQVAKTFFDTGYISPFTNEWGVWSDSQVPNTYSHYSDIAMETLLLLCQPIMEKATGLKLDPNYSYARIYKKGDVLKKHTDRFSCEISTTMNLGGDKWPIYLKSNNKKIKVDLNPGDMLVYRGCDLEHWREVFKGKDCIQVFLHYNNCKTPGADKNIFDRRTHLGLPAWFKR